MLEQIKKEEVVDISGAVEKIRQQKLNMVQTLVRVILSYIHHAKHFITISKYTYFACDASPVTLPTNSGHTHI